MRLSTAICLALACTAAHSTELTLRQALELAKSRNGRVAAARAQAAIARSGVIVAEAAYWPKVTPEYRYSDRFSGGDGGTGGLSFHQLGVRSSWLLLDAGTRGYAVARSRSVAGAAEYSAVDTLRSTLFLVTQLFFEALRAQELLKVAEAQVSRAKQTEDVTKQQAELGAIPKKDILQAQADLANALVAVISARNSVSTTQSALRAAVGWMPGEPAPVLSDVVEGVSEPDVHSQDEAIARGLSKRPDLEQSRKLLQADRYGLKSVEQQAGLDWSLSVDYSRFIEPDNTDSRGLSFLLTFPLIDGGVARENVRQSRLSLEANRRLLQQQELDVRSEIESAYLEWQQDSERLRAAESAREAARENYKAASESQSEGVASVVDVTAAQVALVTAETNYVQALYDKYISTVLLNLVIGDPIPGEQN
jgi:outer membrane protein